MKGKADAMSTKSILLALFGICLLQFNPAHAQSAADPVGDTRPGAPAWTDLTNVTVLQDDRFISLTLQTADTIPKHVQDSCQFQFLLQTEPQGTTTMSRGQDAHTCLIAFDLTHWDGSPWFATSIFSRYDKSGIPADTMRMFDWKLSGKSFNVRFSLESLGWTSVKVRARVFYGTGIADVAPDSGWVSLVVDRSRLQDMRTRSGSRTIFTYPLRFDSLITRLDVLQLVDAACRYESELTSVTPVGGDTIRFIFNPFFGGAAIEGSPIYLGPGMWGKNPLWFVYFHEMGHNFVNASARFRQLCPLEMKLVPGPLPTNILFYEAWASLPAMYVFDMMDLKGREAGVRDSALSHLLNEWRSTRSRFLKAWEKYKENPVYSSLNPDVVDGMFLELQDQFGWSIFKKWFALMRPATQPLALFDGRLPDDTPDLRTTRCTFTAAVFSAAAGSDLQQQFKKWGLPVDEKLFTKAFNELRQLTH
jgi:hypothetical protein